MIRETLRSLSYFFVYFNSYDYNLDFLKLEKLKLVMDQKADEKVGSDPNLA